MIGRTGRIGLACLLLLCALVVGAGAAGCSQPAAGAVTDDLGREVQLDSIPQRIVSHVPSITETLFALGLGDRVVGRSDYCNYPPEALEKPSVGGYYTPSIEKIAALDPDLVLTDGYVADIGKLDALGIPWVVLDPKDIDGYMADIELLGRIAGKQKEASDLVSELRDGIDGVVASVAGEPRPRVFYVFDATVLSQPWTAGPGSFVDSFINLAGGDNVAADASDPWLQFSMEALVDADPQVILVDTAMGTAVASPDEFKADPVWQKVTAVKDDRISIIDGDLMDRPSPRLVEGLQDLVRIFHPDLVGSGDGGE
jgi:iron complex transport system substrate-binding protein